VLSRRLPLVVGLPATAALVVALSASANVVVTVVARGAWYARALAGSAPPPRWLERTAALVWRAVGGRVGRDR
jgi:hypothetical protein